MGCKSSKAAGKNIIETTRSPQLAEECFKKTLPNVKFYWYPSSAQCRSVLLLMLKIGICPEDFHIIDLTKGEHKSEEFTKVNPDQCIPCLVDGNRDGLTLCNCRSIMLHLLGEYCDDDKICEELYSKIHETRDLVDKYLTFDEDEMYPAIADYMYPIIFDGIDKSSEELEKAQNNLKEKLSTLDKYIKESKKKFIIGNEMSLADVALSCSIFSLEILQYDLSMFKHVQKWITLTKSLKIFTEANKGLEDWKRILKECETEKDVNEGNPFLEKEKEDDIQCRRYSKDSKVGSMKSGYEEREII